MFSPQISLHLWPSHRNWHPSRRVMGYQLLDPGLYKSFSLTKTVISDVSRSFFSFLFVYTSEATLTFYFQPLLRFAPIFVIPPGVVVLPPAGVVDDTKSTAVLPLPVLSASFSFARPSRDSLNFVLKAHSGKALGSHNSRGSVVSYWRPSSISANPMSLSIRPGFLSAVELSSLELKWIPFFLRSRNCWNFLLVPGGGDPGGDGGMSMTGTDGSVRLWMRARFDEYGEPGS